MTSIYVEINDFHQYYAAVSVNEFIIFSLLAIFLIVSS